MVAKIGKNFFWIQLAVVIWSCGVSERAFSDTGPTAMADKCASMGRSVIAVDISRTCKNKPEDAGAREKAAKNLEVVIARCRSSLGVLNKDTIATKGSPAYSIDNHIKCYEGVNRRLRAGECKGILDTTPLCDE